MNLGVQITVAEGRPYPPTGIDSKQWRQLPAETVPIADMVTTQRHLDLEALVHDLRSPWSDDLPNVVAHAGHLYLEDGHHRVARALLAGETHILARVFRRGGGS